MLRLLSLLAFIGYVSSFTPSFRSYLQLRNARVNPRASSTQVPRMMFSGIVEEMGIVRSLEEKTDMKMWDGSTGSGTELCIESDGTVLDGAYDGASIAVNGVCLTVIEFDDKSFRVGLAPETLRRSNLPLLEAGQRVNLERALAADARNSGHFVQGHVDETGTILELRPEGDSLWVKVGVSRELMRYIVPKGFIAIDGTSLTVCETNVAEGWFNFMLVAYTQKHIIIPSKSLGDKVNVEVDVLGKLVERSLGNVLDRLDALEARLQRAGLE
mmetsp:Transcript_22243/g.35057  ORF Transcript_22243/g.35057 Transcript_22243/m.35057 type:complete len:271 (-) Transcript_22243:591-1403(-)